MRNSTSSLYLAAAIILAVSASGCLKTRSQLRNDDDDRGESSKPTPAQVQDVEPKAGYVLDEMKSEMTRLNGRIEDLERSQKQGGASSVDAKKLETRVAELEQAQASMLEAIKKMQENVPAPDAVEIFEKGRKQYDANLFDMAVESFSLYLKNPKAKHAEEATFMRAESYFALKEYKKAIVDYSKFPEKYSHSGHMSTALLKIALSFDALGMKEDAKGFYQELVDKFPKSSEAKKARSRLK